MGREGALLYTSIVTVWIYRRDQAEHVHPPLLYPKESWPWIKSLIYDRYTCISIPQRADYRAGRNGREVGRCFFVESVPTIPTLYTGGEGGTSSWFFSTPRTLFYPSSYRIHFRLFQLRRAFFALLPRGWCFRGSATDKIFRVEAGYSRAVFPDVRIFLARISLERNSRERGESPSVKIFEERKFLLGIFLDLCKTPVTFNFSSDK